MLSSIAGFEQNLYSLAHTWRKGQLPEPHEFPSTVPCFPNQMRFQEIVAGDLLNAQWDVAAAFALHCASRYPVAAQDSLRAALAGAAKHDWIRVMDMQPEDGKDAVSKVTNLPEWLYVYWRSYCKKDDVSLPH